MNIPFNDFYLSGTLPRPQGSDLMSGLLQPASEPTEIAVQNLEVMLSWTSAFPKSLTVPPHLAGRLAKHAQHAGLADGEAGLCHISINSRCVVGLILCWRGGVELEAEILAADQFSHRAAKSGCQM
jgi:hypothetical protein